MSIADVEVDGPFSLFPGSDRTIMLIEGRGMVLDAGAHGSIALLEHFHARNFSGDWIVFGKLVSGPVRDFNLIVRRDRGRGSLEAMSFDGHRRVTCPAGSTLVCHILKGSTEIAREGDTLVANADLELTPHTGHGVTAILARIQETA